jgi:hypothetical protein
MTRIALASLGLLVMSACSYVTDGLDETQENGDVLRRRSRDQSHPDAGLQGAPKAKGDRVQYTILSPATGPSSTRAESLCELVRFFPDGAGFYRVTKLTGVTEEVYGRPGVYDGFTYVELELLSAWSPSAPTNPVARISGGPDGNGATRSFDVELAVGETVGLLLRKLPDNYGYFSLDPLGCWKLVDGGLTNGQILTKTRMDAAALGAILRVDYAATPGTCPQDLAPDVIPASSTPSSTPSQVSAGTGSSVPLGDTSATQSVGASIGPPASDAGGEPVPGSGG